VTTRQAIKILRDYNAWRLGEVSAMRIDNMKPGDISQASGLAVKALSGKVKS
jgi:hypothetical protein